ncbi:MAG: ATP-binding cassette domain-containing protein [Candidatus Lokiarchaeota archaeon]|nr:ATP-binding cassette domain-containing protein [Candidatus Lokiarchaeota archaeon]MBD3200933.1 ATP-binding cassette domain-containing protein [Candidatus Lokiarchaeota archaeon]
MWVINIPFIEYFTDEEVKNIKNNMVYFSYTHQNPDNGLFVEPKIENNFRAIDSINFSNNIFNTSNLIHPLNNSHLTYEKRNFFINYLFEKQNSDGSFSDIGGLGTMYSTYKVIRTIDILNSSYLDDPKHQNRIKKVLYFLNQSMEENGWGFKLHPAVNLSDIISTCYAIKLAKRFNANEILNNDNISQFINATRFNTEGGHALTILNQIVTQETNYHGIVAFLEMNNTYNSLIPFTTYFSLTYRLGGYADVSTGVSNVQATYYALASQYTLGLSPINEINSFNYVLSCNKTDGGFGYQPYLNYSSDFKSGWAALNAINLLEKNATASLLANNQIKIDYYNWLYNYQAMNGLFGDISLQTNYYGVTTLYNFDSEIFSKYIQINKIIDFVNSCYNPEDGGFSSQPDNNSTIYSSFCAIELYDLLEPYTLTWLPNETATEQYFVQLQNADGGFKIGEDVDLFISLFGGAFNEITQLINTNTSTVESSFWASYSLQKLNAFHLINQNTLNSWITSCQNADGGFSIFLGYYSDVISTYYGIEIHNLFNEEPASRIAGIEFLKNSQKEDGSFELIPSLASFVSLPSSFIGTYLASYSLYEYRSQPEYVMELVSWFSNCYSRETGGIGDYENFGGDLHNMPSGMLIIEELRYDQSFDPLPWSRLLIWIMISEALALVAFFLIIIISYLNTSLIKKIKATVGIGEKLNIEYLKRFPAVYCENLSIYAGRKLIVDGVTLDLEHGEVLGVLGESGAGKSTFVKSLLGMRNYKGICEIYGMDAKKNRRKFRPLYGYVPQDLGKIYTKFTTLQNIIYFGQQYGLTEKEIVSRAKRILRSLEIEDKMNELVENLSGGQKRRVSIAMALIHNPVLCILDEPTSGLDPVVRENLWLVLTKINEKFNTTLIVISHYPEESRFCNKVVVFGRNRGMIDFGKPNELLNQLPGKGRTIELFFYDIQDNAVERLESINGIKEVLENKVGTDFAVLTDLNLKEIREKIEFEFGENSILGLKQSESQMQEYFRYKAMEVPEIE